MFRSGGAGTSYGGAISHGGHTLTSGSDLEVAEILLSLPHLIDSNVRWGSKKKRSVITSHKSLGSPGNANSPSTPLDFPDNSDDNSGNKVFKRKRCEELRLREDIHRLEKRTKLCTEDIDPVLRAKKLVLLQLIFDVDLTQLENSQEIRPKNSSISTGGDDHQKIPIHIHEEEEEPVTGLGPSTTVLFPSPISQAGNVRPFEIPDLNLTTVSDDECFQPLDLSLGSNFINGGEDDE